ncbi:methyltransferase domain-containing protein [Antarcticibacterium arcticum]|uniref:Methyltransferase domain-containing protein n=1 Tax=Antarcticibacterium arcticum TaxID=2585771 RepID=A0A5B8YEL3_9FLAO|nr:methyltransferase domain-containing protein [Antarcticibacterium arcticum]QED36340.1 methyltransferase domain-containing protein [Antarcticibacterium arcticum]
MKTDMEFWSSRYRENSIGWDLGEISPPLKAYIDQLNDKTLNILIPGAGNSYEAEYLFKKGFENVYVVDIAKEPLANLKERVPEFPEGQLMHVDFFEMQGKFDLILEQTFFCALPVNLREAYAHKVADLLKENGKIAGVFFNTHFTKEGPPFGGSKEEYLTYFSKSFSIETIEPCYNSILPREGNELFFIFKKN